MRTISIIILSFIMVFTSCDKENEEANQVSAQALEDNAEFENTFNGLESVIVDVSDKESDNATYEYETCANITVMPAWSSGQFPKTITIDFGDSNCLGRDGNYRRGEITIDLSGRYRDSGTVITTNLIDFYFNNSRVEGTKIKKNKGRNGLNNLVYEVNVTNGKLHHVNGYTIEWESNRELEWIAGENTIFNIFDDEYSIRGTANGVTRESKTYDLSIIEDLNVKLNCRWIRSGKIAIKPEDFNERTVDYGDGTCDRLATYSVNGKDYQFSMR